MMTHRIDRIAIVLVALLASFVASAEELRVHITPYGGYRFGGDFAVQESMTTVDLDDSAAFGFLVNVRHSANTTWEVLYSRQQTEAKLNDPMAAASIADLDIDVLQLGGTYHGAGDRVQPYVALTLGGTHIRTSASGRDSDTFFSGSIGLGVNMLPSSRFGFRLEARAYGTLTDANTDLFCRTGPDINFCAIRIEGELLRQVEAFAGLTYRF